MKKITVKQMTICGIFAALMCIAGPLSIPIGPVPVSLTNLVIYFAVMIIGTKISLTSYIVYLLLGTVGLPVFSNSSGGVAKLVGPTGGYLVGFALMLVISGIAAELSKRNIVVTMLGMFIGTAVAYLFGTVWFVFQQKCSFAYAMGICVEPFIIFDLIKIVIAFILGKEIRKRLVKANLISEKAIQKTDKE